MIDGPIKDRGCFPLPDAKVLKWKNFGTSLRLALKYDDCNLSSGVKGRSQKAVRELDSFLEKLSDSYPSCPQYNFEERFPRTYDLYFKFLELWRYFLNEETEKKDFDNSEDNGYRIGNNILIDLRRVARRIISNEPIYLIPEQVKTFRDFAEMSSRPPLRELY